MNKFNNASTPLRGALACRILIARLYGVLPIEVGQRTRRDPAYDDLVMSLTEVV